MKKIAKMAKNPITWIVFALACVVGVIIWAFTGKTDVIDDLTD